MTDLAPEAAADPPATALDMKIPTVTTVAADRDAV